MYIPSRTAEKFSLCFMTGFNLYMHILPTLLKNQPSLYHVVYLFIVQMTFFTCVLILLYLFALKTNTEKNVTKTHHHRQQQLY